MFYYGFLPDKRVIDLPPRQTLLRDELLSNTYSNVFFPNFTMDTPGPLTSGSGIENRLNLIYLQEFLTSRDEDLDIMSAVYRCSLDGEPAVRAAGGDSVVQFTYYSVMYAFFYRCFTRLMHSPGFLHMLEELESLELQREREKQNGQDERGEGREGGDQGDQGGSETCRGLEQQQASTSIPASHSATGAETHQLSSLPRLDVAVIVRYGFSKYQDSRHNIALQIMIYNVLNFIRTSFSCEDYISYYAREQQEQMRGQACRAFNLIFRTKFHTIVRPHFHSYAILASLGDFQYTGQSPDEQPDDPLSPIQDSHENQGSQEVSQAPDKTTLVFVTFDTPILAVTKTVATTMSQDALISDYVAMQCGAYKGKDKPSREAVERLTKKELQHVFWGEKLIQQEDMVSFIRSREPERSLDFLLRVHKIIKGFNIGTAAPFPQNSSSIDSFSLNCNVHANTGFRRLFTVMLLTSVMVATRNFLVAIGPRTGGQGAGHCPRPNIRLIKLRISYWALGYSSRADKMLARALNSAEKELGAKKRCFMLTEDFIEVDEEYFILKIEEILRHKVGVSRATPDLLSQRKLLINECCFSSAMITFQEVWELIHAGLFAVVPETDPRASGKLDGQKGFRSVDRTTSLSDIPTEALRHGLPYLGTLVYATNDSLTPPTDAVIASLREDPVINCFLGPESIPASAPANAEAESNPHVPDFSRASGIFEDSALGSAVHDELVVGFNRWLKHFGWNDSRFLSMRRHDCRLVTIMSKFIHETMPLSLPDCQFWRRCESVGKIPLPTKVRKIAPDAIDAVLAAHDSTFAGDIPGSGAADSHQRDPQFSRPSSPAMSHALSPRTDEIRTETILTLDLCNPAFFPTLTWLEVVPGSSYRVLLRLAGRIRSRKPDSFFLMLPQFSMQKAMKTHLILSLVRALLIDWVIQSRSPASMGLEAGGPQVISYSFIRQRYPSERGPSDRPFAIINSEGGSAPPPLPWMSVAEGSLPERQNYATPVWSLCEGNCAHLLANIYTSNSGFVGPFLLAALQIQKQVQDFEKAVFGLAMKRKAASFFTSGGPCASSRAGSKGGAQGSVQPSPRQPADGALECRSSSSSCQLVVRAPSDAPCDTPPGDVASGPGGESTALPMDPALKLPPDDQADTDDEQLRRLSLLLEMQHGAPAVARSSAHLREELLSPLLHAKEHTELPSVIDYSLSIGGDADCAALCLFTDGTFDLPRRESGRGRSEVDGLPFGRLPSGTVDDESPWPRYYRALSDGLVKAVSAGPTAARVVLALCCIQYACRQAGGFWRDLWQHLKKAYLRPSLGKADGMPVEVICRERLSPYEPLAGQGEYPQRTSRILSVFNGFLFCWDELSQSTVPSEATSPGGGEPRLLSPTDAESALCRAFAVEQGFPGGAGRKKHRLTQKNPQKAIPSSDPFWIETVENERSELAQGQRVGADPGYRFPRTHLPTSRTFPTGLYTKREIEPFSLAEEAALLAHSRKRSPVITRLIEASYTLVPPTEAYKGVYTPCWCLRLPPDKPSDGALRFLLEPSDSLELQSPPEDAAQPNMLLSAFLSVSGLDMGQLAADKRYSFYLSVLLTWKARHSPSAALVVPASASAFLCPPLMLGIDLRANALLFAYPRTYPLLTRDSLHLWASLLDVDVTVIMSMVLNCLFSLLTSLQDANLILWNFSAAHSRFLATTTPTSLTGTRMELLTYCLGDGRGDSSQTFILKIQERSDVRSFVETLIDWAQEQGQESQVSASMGSLPCKGGGLPDYFGLLRNVLADNNVLVGRCPVSTSPARRVWDFFNPTHDATGHTSDLGGRFYGSLLDRYPILQNVKRRHDTITILANISVISLSNKPSEEERNTLKRNRDFIDKAAEKLGFEKWSPADLPGSIKDIAERIPTNPGFSSLLRFYRNAATHTDKHLSVADYYMAYERLVPRFFEMVIHVVRRLSEHDASFNTKLESVLFVW